MNPTILFGSLWMFMIVGDLGTTFLGLSIGLVEGNPIGAGIIGSFGLGGFIIFAVTGKIISFNTLAWLHGKCQKNEDKPIFLSIRKFIEFNVVGLLIIFIGIFCWNSLLLYSALGVI